MTYFLDHPVDETSFSREWSSATTWVVLLWFDCCSLVRMFTQSKEERKKVEQALESMCYPCSKVSFASRVFIVVVISGSFVPFMYETGPERHYVSVFQPGFRQWHPRFYRLESRNGN